MGLDMYLTQRLYVGADFVHNKIQGTIDLTRNGVPMPVDVSRVVYIDLFVAYWRKANQIHRWFVDNCQDGKDECQESEVSIDELATLRGLCGKVLSTKDTSLLSPQQGFFFGSTAVDDYYFETLTYTVNALENLDPRGGYVYRASW